jgi:hypothetical protein
VTNTGVAGTTLTFTAAPGVTGSSQFAITPGGTCTATTALMSGDSCTVIVTRTRPATSPFGGAATLTITDTGAATSSQTLALSGT